MQADRTFIKNEQYMHADVSAWIPSDWCKEHGSTKERLERPAPTKMEQAWNGLIPCCCWWYWFIETWSQGGITVGFKLD